jgi:hypothetical protein
VDPVVHLALRGSLALLLLAAALHKLRDPRAFRAILVAYELVPAGLAGAAAAAVLAAEVLLGAALLAPGMGVAPALGTAALLAVYTGAIGVNLARGRRDFDCGCGGPARGVPLGGALLARNGILLLGAALAAVPPATRDLVWVDAITVAGAVGAAALAYAAAQTALANAAVPGARPRASWGRA